ncbi:MAG: hypothetical protein FVQ81_11755 [Candidatus Glassbacteria bacterium]|nr:hypothetical protein [Candidatus Glassbacteria bacterium]
MENPRKPPSTLLHFALLPVLLAVMLAHVGAAAQNAVNLDLTVREIVADNSGQGLDSRLDDIGRDLKKLAYSTFRLEKTHTRKLEGEAQVRLELLGKNILLIDSQGVEEGKIRLKVKLTPGDKKQRSFESTLRIPDGGTFIIGGPAYGDGVLILAFTAKK